MNYTRLSFWLFFFAVAGVCLVARVVLRRILRTETDTETNTVDLVLLALASLTMFACFSPLSCGILVVEAGLTLLLTRAAVQASTKGGGKAILAANLFVLLGSLAFFKYINPMLAAGAIGPGGADGAVAAPWLPPGISFYTFAMAAFAIDSVREKERPPGLLLSGNMFAFFPLVLSGPIERKSQLIPQLRRFAFTLRLGDVAAGLPWIVLGFFFKFVLADNIGPFIHTQPADNAYLVWLASLLFGLKLYFDFAGYSFIALGVARLFGVELQLNFLAPFLSTSIREFWRRWHVTLLTWLRDYVYIPMGGNRTGIWFVNVLVVWLVSGAWHGSSLNYLCWGLLHACYLGLERLLSPIFKLPRFLAWIVTFTAVNFSWVVFYERDMGTLLHKARILATPSAYSGRMLAEALGHYPIGDILPLAGTLVLALCILWCELVHKHEANPYAVLLDARVATILAVCLPLLSAGGTTPFVYFAF